jgi:hypothetical protein
MSPVWANQIQDTFRSGTLSIRLQPADIPAPETQWACYLSLLSGASREWTLMRARSAYHCAHQSTLRLDLI